MPIPFVAADGVPAIAPALTNLASGMGATRPKEVTGPSGRAFAPCGSEEPERRWCYRRPWGRIGKCTVECISPGGALLPTV